jgi:hypothetical protein
MPVDERLVVALAHVEEAEQSLRSAREQIRELFEENVELVTMVDELKSTRHLRVDTEGRL